MKEKRLVLMVEPELLQSIDEYRYSNHIPSRSEALRRLIEKSLKQWKGPKDRKDEQQP